MKRYNVNVNGTDYDVAVEELEEGAVATPVVAAAPKAKPAPVAVKHGAGSTKIESPMPGTIVEIKVKIGDKVKNGSPIAVLEAMKMENDIVASGDGVVASIDVIKGQSVNTGTVVATLN